MELKKHFFEDNQVKFEDIMKSILDSEIHKIVESLIDEREKHENSTLEVA